MSRVSIFMIRRQVKIQTLSEMTSYFTLTKCNKLFITYIFETSYNDRAI